MKKPLYLLIMIIFSICWGCSDSGDSPDPLAELRAFAVDLRQTSYDALTQTGTELGELDDSDPLKDDYLVSMEDLLIGQTYGVSILNKVINFKIRSVNGSVYTNTERDSTIDVSGGRYVFSSDYYIFFEEAGTVERIHVDFTYNPSTNRWLFQGLRGGTSTVEPADAWFKQEGDIVGVTDYYIATTFFFEEEGISHINNLLLVYGSASVSIQMTCERPICAADCVDITTTSLYTLGILASGFQLWDDFKDYAMDSPDYEI
ncbi:MAG: hypothetical protein KKD44_02565 [Proteobacteria bacterium]|nr:hypothetical protein [Pseudomonadota bacterium]